MVLLKQKNRNKNQNKATGYNFPTSLTLNAELSV